MDTRLRKVESGEYDVMMPAKPASAASGSMYRITEVFSPEVFLPAVGQGAIGVECRSDDAETSVALEKLDDAETRSAIIAERSLLSTLEGDLPGSAGRMGAHRTRRTRPRSLRL